MKPTPASARCGSCRASSDARLSGFLPHSAPFIGKFGGQRRSHLQQQRHEWQQHRRPGGDSAALGNVLRWLPVPGFNQQNGSGGDQSPADQQQRQQQASAPQQADGSGGGFDLRCACGRVPGKVLFRVRWHGCSKLCCNC